MEDELKGLSLIGEVVALTGLPSASIEQELLGLIEKTGKNPESLTLLELRESMLAYLEQIDGEQRNSCS